MSAKAQQENLDFGRVYRVSDSARQLYRSLNDAVDQVGILPATGACNGVHRSDLRRALDRDGRGVWVEHAMSIAAMAAYDIRRAVAERFLEPLDLRVADNTPPMSDKERADRCEAALRALGPIGEQYLVNALGGRR